MKFSEEILHMLGWSNKGEDFIVGKDDFSNLQINASVTNERFFYFYDTRNRRLIKQFLLNSKPQVDYICQVVLIKDNGKFTPRLALSVRDKKREIMQEPATEPTNVKANVDLKECHENFWKLISYIQSLSEIDTPQESFSLVSQDEGKIVAALRGRGAESIVSIVRQLAETEDVTFSFEDINQLLKRREKLDVFKRALETKNSEEKKWQNFFEANKWIFGYGLDYQILQQEQSQPHYGGISVDGAGGQRGDYLTSTRGDLNFTVLVEIKTPATRLLQGTAAVRNGAWSLSKDLADAITQIGANIATWEKDGSRQDSNRDRFEGEEKIFTVKPKGIIVIGLLSELDNRDKRETFQRFRKSIHGIDILTYDELYERARFIVEQKD